MSKLTVIKILPGEPGFQDFLDFPSMIYDKDSPRFVLGNDPVRQHLEGCYIVQQGERNVARFAIYQNPELKLNGQHVFTFGSFECIHDQSVANFVFDRIVDRVKTLGGTKLVGPMEGSTWNNYRFSESNAHPNFFMEPFHHEYYVDMVRNYGFESLLKYTSNLDTKLEYDEFRIKAYEKELLEQGAKLRSINMQDLANDLYRIAEFSNESYKNNTLFTPIDPEDFVAKYIQLKQLFNPELIWIVEDKDGVILAVSFSIRDYNDPTGETIVIKSLARRPNAPFKGIGAYLADKTYEIAVQQGCKRIIHAFMIVDNFSVQLSNDFTGKSYKSYSLFGLDV